MAPYQGGNDKQEKNSLSKLIKKVFKDETVEHLMQTIEMTKHT